MQEEKIENLRLSVSKTKTFKDCAKKFHFAYILKLPQKDRDYHIFGKFCHAVLEYYHQSYIAGSTDPDNINMSSAYKRAISEYSDKMTPDMRRECYKIINNYLQLMSNKRKNNCFENVLAVEKQFEIKLVDNVILNGVIDKIMLDGDNILHIADYKSSKSSKFLKNDFLQLKTYAFAMLNENPGLETIRCSYIMLKHNFEFITKEFHKEEILEVKQLYVDYANKILNEKEFVPTPTKLCSFCDFLPLCDAGQQKVGNANVNDFVDTNIFGETNW